MGKILESIGIIDGYDIILINKSKANKDELFVEIIKEDKDIKEEVRKIVETSTGRVFAIVKNKIIKGIYLFKVEEKEETNNLKLIKTVYTKEVKEEVKEKYDNHILELAKDYVTNQEYDKVTLEDKVVSLDQKINKKEQGIALLSGFTIGFVIGWMIFGKFYLGLIYGLIFAPLFSGIDVVISNKRGRKKKEKKEGKLNE